MLCLLIDYFLCERSARHMAWEWLRLGKARDDLQQRYRAAAPKPSLTRTDCTVDHRKATAFKLQFESHCRTDGKELDKSAGPDAMHDKFCSLALCLFGTFRPFVR